jgi:Flp pilus assembly protein TadD
MSNYLIRNQRYDDAIKYLNELVELDIATKEVFNSLGVAYKGLDNDAKAREMFNKALELDAHFELAKGNLESLS